MLVFLATILVNLSFALLVRAAQRRGVDVVASGVVNYAFAAVTYWVIVLVTATPYAPEAPRIGVTAGVFYVSTYLLLLPQCGYAAWPSPWALYHRYNTDRWPLWSGTGAGRSSGRHRARCALPC